MEMRQLRYFVAVAKYLNFSRAAQSLYISQPALSKQIIELEKELKTQLFVRNRRTIYLTERGMEMLLYAQKIVSIADEMLIAHGHSAFPMVSTERIRIAFDNDEHPQGWQQELKSLADFTIKYPGVDLKLEQNSVRISEEKLLNHEIDFMFSLLRHQDSPRSELCYHTFDHDVLAIVVSNRLNIFTLEDAINQMPVCLLMNRSKSHARIVRSLVDQGLKPDIVYVQSIMDCLMLAQSGKGLMFIPKKNYLRESPDGLRAIPLTGDSVKVCKGLIWNPQNMNSAGQLFLNYCREKLI